MGVAVKLEDKLLTTYLHDSGVVVMPTDTVYGLACRAADQAAVKRLYAIKRRSPRPGTLIAASVEQLTELGLKRRYITAVEKFWPGPISVLIPCGPELGYIHLGTYSIACRIPKDPALVNLLRKTGALLTTSANITGEDPVSTIKGAVKIFGETVDAYVDGGDLGKRKPSTLIRVLDDMVEVVREGAVIVSESGEVEG